MNIMESKACCGGMKKETIAPTGFPAGFKAKLVVYRPLIVITLVAFLAAYALMMGALLPLMDGLMGLFLILLATLQLFDLRGYANSFAKYDLVAARWPLYGLAYPFIELVLGLSYLAGTLPLATNLVMLAIMVVGTIGVVRTVRSGVAVQCACAGTGFSLPVGRVTIAENTIMGLMAAINLYHYALHAA